MSVAEGDVRLMLGDCLERMAEIEDQSIDVILCDPPYPEVSRAYGRMTEAEWHAMMRGVVAESRRILKPSGSAVFILQPNSERVGRMRPWLWEFMAWTAREWNMVQDAWWWNFTSVPSGGACSAGLMRSSLKACVWLGPEGCHRDQDSVLWEESQYTTARRLQARAGKGLHAKPSPCGIGINSSNLYEASERRGGVTPFNVLPFDNANPYTSGGSTGHGAATPFDLCDWWVRYLTPEGGTVCDPFTGSGTVGLAALKRGRKFVGIERDADYFATASSRIKQEMDKHLLFAG